MKKYPEVEIGRVCLPTEQIDPRLAPNESFNYVDISSVTKEQRQIEHAQRLFGKDAPSGARKAIRAGDVLVSTIRPDLNAVAIVPSHLDGQIASTDFCVLRANPALLDHRYLFYRTVTETFVNNLVGRMSGATIPRVTDGIVKEVTIPLPTLSEQRRIVEILDQAALLRRRRADADAKTERILPSLFYNLFGDPVTNPLSWPTTSLAEVLVSTQDGSSTQAEANSQGTAVIRMNNIDVRGNLQLDDVKYAVLSEAEIAQYRLEPGDVLFNRINSKEIVGKTGLWHGSMEAVPHSSLIRFRVDTTRVLPEYVWAYMNTPYIKQILFNKARHAIGMAKITTRELSELPLMEPSPERQQQFTRLLMSIRRIQTHQEYTRERIASVFALLLQQAFNGELTARWREVHLQELLVEMEQQVHLLDRLK